MIISIWVFLILGEPVEQYHGTPYVQMTCPAFVHDTDHVRTALEQSARERFEHMYPGQVVADSGWHKQEIRVMGDG